MQKINTETPTLKIKQQEEENQNACKSKQLYCKFSSDFLFPFLKEADLDSVLLKTGVVVLNLDSIYIHRINDVLQLSRIL